MYKFVYHYSTTSISTGTVLPFASETIEKFVNMAKTFNVVNYCIEDVDSGKKVYKSDRYKELEDAELAAKEKKDIVNAERIVRLNEQQTVFTEGLGSYHFKIYRRKFTEDLYKKYGRTVSSFLECFIVINKKEIPIRIESYISEGNRILYSSWTKWGYSKSSNPELGTVSQKDFKRIVKFYLQIKEFLKGIAYENGKEA